MKKGKVEKKLKVFPIIITWKFIFIKEVFKNASYGRFSSHYKCFKIFHMSKTKDGGKEWASEHAEALHLNIYRKVIGKASHGRVLDMGSGIKTNDVYGCCEGSCKRARVDKNEELELKIKNMEEELQQYKVMKGEFEQLKATQEEVKQMREFMKYPEQRLIF
ncbi:hypothetical protein ACOSQ2_007592 [Xanthoceras sorbifolium]